MSNLAKPAGAGGSALLTELPKRKRGRPRKQPQEPVGPLPPKKPRGRPRGSKKLSAKSGQVHTSAEKRPRGRPRKWLVVQEEEYPNACVQESGNPSSNTRPTTEGTSGKSCHRINRTTGVRRQLSTSPAAVQQQPAC